MRRTACEAATLTVRAGEVVGLAGLVGAGRTELARAIFGADRVDSRHASRVDGRPLRGGPVGAVRAGVGLVPENRKADGLALTPIGAGQRAPGRAPQAVSSGLVPRVAGGSRAPAERDRAPPDRDAVARPADAAL